MIKNGTHAKAPGNIEDTDSPGDVPLLGSNPPIQRTPKQPPSVPLLGGDSRDQMNRTAQGEKVLQRRKKKKKKIQRIQPSRKGKEVLMALLAVTGHVCVNMASTVPSFVEPANLRTPSITLEQDFEDKSFLHPRELKALFEIQMMDKMIDDPNKDMNWDIISISQHQISRTQRQLPLSWDTKDISRTKHI